MNREMVSKIFLL